MAQVLYEDKKENHAATWCGRNGAYFQFGIRFTMPDNLLWIEPLRKNGIAGHCRISVPKENIESTIEAMMRTSEIVPSMYSVLASAPRKETPTIVYDAIERILNAGDWTEQKELAHKLVWQHNTLQQTFMRVIMEFLRETVKKPFIDARNQATYDMAKKILEVTKDDYLPMV